MLTWRPQTLLCPLPKILVFLSGLEGRRAHLAGPGLWSELFASTGFLLVSGIYDLEPFISTSQNAPLHMTLEDAQRNSPQRRLEVAPAWPVGPACPVLVLVAQHDSPEFHRQSREFCETLLRVGCKASFQQLRGVDHFDIIENLTREDDALTQIILKTIFRAL